ncbi:MAG TPA: peptidoglycan DD-metalloendopeptidase family protein [Candidatus Eisenbacteria bacterium]|nr:peptidoglycan DD-metalloendopeptidase family protein [Candidatus Eisenbacteria bacterium]
MRAARQSTETRLRPSSAQARFLAALILGIACVFAATVSIAEAQGDAPVAGAFVYPVGDESDFTKAHPSEPLGFKISDSYLVRRGRKLQRVHLGVDLSSGRGGATVRSIGSGVVVVADASARIKVRKKQRVKVASVVNGKRVTKTVTRTRNSWKWRTGWGNYVVVAHTLPNGQTVHSLYGHLAPKSVLVKKGDVVAAAQPIGKVGRTGRASSAHLHLEIRKTLPALPEEESTESHDEDEQVEAEVEPTVEYRSFARLQTVDPVAFLEQHVRHFDDLTPGSWEARYALAAARDGIFTSDLNRFDPERPVTRGEYYRALLVAFRLGTPFTGRAHGSAVDALVDAGILDAQAERGKSAGDRLSRSDALEILLRCLDKCPAKGLNLGAIQAEQVCRDFNRTFAGQEAALRAEREAREVAARETLEKRKAADAEYARALRAAKAKGAGATKKPRVKRRSVKPVAPVYGLDAGFEKVAQSKEHLSRAEACLLLTSAKRFGSTQTSALGRAAARLAATTSG